MNTKQTVGCDSCRGITLVELLVSMAIGLFLLSGVVKVMLDGKDGFLLQGQISYMQENARFAIDQMTYDIRMAGYYGCSTQGQLTNSIDGSTDNSSWMFSSNGIKGFEYTELADADFPAELASIHANTDVVIVNRGEPDDALQVKEHKPASAVIKLTQPSNLAVGQILVIASPGCADMAIFQMTGPSNTSNPDQINHNKGNANPSPGNCHKALTSGYDCTSPPDSSYTGGEYPPGSVLMQFSSSAYFIGASTVTGLPTLYRQTLTVVDGEPVTEAQDLANGIENLQIIYGVDTDTTPDGEVNRYYTAEDIPNNVADAGSDYVGWDRVVAVRVTLIVRSASEMFPGDTAVDLGDGFTYNDRYLRQKVSTTVRIRNRGLGIGS